MSQKNKTNNFTLGLRKLLSSNIVVRHDKKTNKLKTIDLDNLQNAKQVNRFDPIYQKIDLITQGNRLQQYGFMNVKLQLFRQYQDMDRDPIPSSILQLYSQQIVAKDQYGDVLLIKSQNQRIVQVLQNLFYEVLNIQFNLPSWTRNALKYGDCYLYLKQHPKYGVVGAIPLSVYLINRVQDTDQNGQDRVIFKSTQTNDQFQLQQIAHFRMLTDTNFLPYGKSILQSARKTWKQLCLLQDAALIHKIMRSPQKRIFNVQVGNLPPKKVQQYMKQFKDNMKKVPFMDPNTNDYNLRYNIMNITQDFFIPRRGANQGNSIQTLSGFQLSFDTQLDYLRKKLMASFRVPPAYIGFQQGVNSRATLASQSIKFARSVQRYQRLIVSQLYKIAQVHLYYNGFRGYDLVDFQLKLNNPSVIYQQQKINLWMDKFNLISNIQGSQLFSQEWIYKNVMNLSDGQIQQERQNILKQIKINKERQKLTQQLDDTEQNIEDNQIDFQNQLDNQQDTQKNTEQIPKQQSKKQIKKANYNDKQINHYNRKQMKQFFALQNVQQKINKILKQSKKQKKTRVINHLNTNQINRLDQIIKNNNLIV